MYVFMCVRVFFFTSCEEGDPRFVRCVLADKKSATKKKVPPQLFERESAARVNVTMRIYKQTVIVGIITSQRCCCCYCCYC